MRLPTRAARQLPDQSTTLRVHSSSTDDSRLRGALPLPDSCSAKWQLLVLHGPLSKHDFLGTFDNPRQPDCEGRPAAGLACHGDVAAHHLTEAPADGEAKASTAVFARRGGGSLGKLLEQLANLLWCHADAGVGHRDRDPVTAVLLSLVSGDGDSAFLGELIGVARQVEQGPPAWRRRADRDRRLSAIFFAIFLRLPPNKFLRIPLTFHQFRSGWLCYFC